VIARAQRRTGGAEGGRRRPASDRSAGATTPFGALQRTAGNRAVNALVPQETVRQRPLDPATRRQAERRFGVGLSDVRLYADDEAERLTRDARAVAVTRASDIFLAPDVAASPEAAGKVLAHELTHVVQQRRGDGQRPASPRTLEQEAEQAATGDGPVAVTGAAPRGAQQAQELQQFDESRQRQRRKPAVGLPPGPPDEQRSLDEALLGTPEEIRAQSGKFASEPDAISQTLRGFAERAPGAFASRLKETAEGARDAIRTYDELLDVALRGGLAAALEKPARPGTVDPSNPAVRYLRENPRARGTADFLKSVLEDFQADRRPLGVRFGEGVDALTEGISGAVKRSLGDLRRELFAAESPREFGGVLGKAYGNLSADATVNAVGETALRGLSAERLAPGPATLANEPADVAASAGPAGRRRGGANAVPRAGEPPCRRRAADRRTARPSRRGRAAERARLHPDVGGPGQGA
jgi:hypothetical protein